jgi:hypothetical protein
MQRRRANPKLWLMNGLVESRPSTDKAIVMVSQSAWLVMLSSYYHWSPRLSDGNSDITFRVQNTFCMREQTRSLCRSFLTWLASGQNSSQLATPLYHSSHCDITTPFSPPYCDISAAYNLRQKLLRRPWWYPRLCLIQTPKVAAPWLALRQHRRHSKAFPWN